MFVLDVRKEGGKDISLDDYTHILAYHACRAEDEQLFRTQGLKPYTKDEALVCAIQKLESDWVSKEEIEAVFDSLWEEIKANQPARVWLMLETKEFLSSSGHYLIYGSEFMNALAMHLGCRNRLKEIGKPMIIECAVPIADISPCWLRDLEESIKNRSTDHYAIAVNRIAAENVIDIHYPTGFVRDPYSWGLYKLG